MTTKVEDLPEDAGRALEMMAAIADGLTPDSSFGQAFRLMLEKDPVGFAKRHVELERAYWAGREGKVKWTGVGVCPTCGRESEGEGDAGGVLTEWLGVKNEGRMAE